MLPKKTILATKLKIHSEMIFLYKIWKSFVYFVEKEGLGGCNSSALIDLNFFLVVLIPKRNGIHTRFFYIWDPPNHACQSQTGFAAVWGGNSRHHCQHFHPDGHQISSRESLSATMQQPPSTGVWGRQYSPNLDPQAQILKKLINLACKTSLNLNFPFNHAWS